MFEDLFIDGPTIERYRATPLLDERLRWLEYCAGTGARRNTLRKIASFQVRLVHLLDLQAGDRIGITRVEAAAEQWSLPGVRSFNKHARPDAHQRFIVRAVQWLRFADMFEEEPRGPRHAHTDEVAVFARWMRRERGWAGETVRVCCNVVDLFFDRLNDCEITLESFASTISTDRSRTGTPAASAG